MVDTYTKVILTVIAVSLSTIAFKDFFVTPVNAGIDGIYWKGFYYEKGFNLAVKKVIQDDCYGQGRGLSDGTYVSVNVDLGCR